MIFPESLEDIFLIVDMYGMTEDDVETWLDTLISYIDVLTSSCDQFQTEIADLDSYREEAQQYSEECSLLYEDLAARMKYDETLVVTVENIVWECVLAAGLAEELEAQVEEFHRLVEAAEAHCDVVRAYRDLLQEYLCREEDEDDYE